MFLMQAGSWLVWHFPHTVGVVVVYVETCTYVLWCCIWRHEYTCCAAVGGPFPLTGYQSSLEAAVIDAGLSHSPRMVACKSGWAEAKFSISPDATSPAPYYKNFFKNKRKTRSYLQSTHSLINSVVAGGREWEDTCQADPLPLGAASSQGDSPCPMNAMASPCHSQAWAWPGTPHILIRTLPPGWLPSWPSDLPGHHKSAWMLVSPKGSWPPLLPGNRAPQKQWNKMSVWSSAQFRFSTGFEMLKEREI